MSERTFSVLAFDPGTESGDHDERRDGIPAWKVGVAALWAIARHKAVLIQETPGVKPSSTTAGCHHVCSDSNCPGGCE